LANTFLASKYGGVGSKKAVSLRVAERHVGGSTNSKVAFVGFSDSGSYLEPPVLAAIQ